MNITITPAKKEVSEYDELLLVEAAAAGDDVSFESLVRLYQAKIRAYAQIYAAKVNEQVDDLAQEIFLQVYLAMPAFKARSKVSTWVFSIAKYTINNKMRKRQLLYFWQFSKNDHKVDEEYFSESLATVDDEQSYYETVQDTLVVRKCLMSLGSRQREILLLYEFAELSYDEISEVLKIRVGTVKSRLFQARKELAERVNKIYE